VITDPSEVGELLGLTYTQEQLDAVAAPMEPLVVIAGAGTGKTTVMAGRVVWLVASGQVSADQVLGLTFTNKAAAELGHRIQTSLDRLAARTGQGLEGTDGAARDDEAAVGPTVSTYHAYAARLLSEQGLRLGVEPDARLLDQPTRFQLATRVLRRAKGPFPHFEVRIPALATRLLALDAELSEQLREPFEVRAFDESLVRELDAVLEAKGKLTAEPARARRTALARLDLLDLVEELRREKRRLSVIDFGDQLALAAQLVRAHPDVGVAERERFRVVLLDEYQDTSVAQKRLLLDLFGGGHSVTAVGDPFQAIYGWRGASVRNILEFPREFARADGSEAARSGLTINNRSGAAILAVANRLAEPLRRDRPEVEPLVPRPERVDPGQVSVGLFATSEDELAWGVEQVVAACAGGTDPGSIAVLGRTGAQIGLWYSALIARGVPVEVVGIGGLLEVPEVADVMATLEVLDDASANPALIRLLTGARWRIGAADLVALRRRAQQILRDHGYESRAGDQSTHTDHDSQEPPDRLTSALLHAIDEADPVDTVSLLEAVLDPGDARVSDEARTRCAALASELTLLRRAMGLPPVDVVAEIIRVSGLDVEVAVRDGATRRPEALAAFLDLADGFSDIEGQVSVRGFLAFLAAAATDARSLDTATPSPSSSVKLMTVHRSKGLEFAMVILPDVTSGTFPTNQSRDRWTKQEFCLPFHLRGDVEDFPTVSTWEGNKGLQAFDDELKVMSEVEERRLAYVAATRAESHLVLTGSWWGPTQKKPRGPSSFLSEAYEVCEAGGGTVVAWAEQPLDEETNPLLERIEEYTWPALLDAEALEHRRRAADDVQSAIERLAPHGTEAALPSLVREATTNDRVDRWRREVALLVEEARRDHTPVREVEMPASLTASAIVRIAEDPERFARDLLRPMPRPPARAAHRGTDFHTWVEHRFGQRSLLDRDDLMGAADEDLVVGDASLKQLQAAFESGPFAHRAPHQVEAPFQILIGDRVVRGRIDAVYLDDDGGFDLIDWKTGAHTADPVQLAVYRMAWARMHDLEWSQVRCGFYYVLEQRLERPDLEHLAPQDVERLLALD